MLGCGRVKAEVGNGFATEAQRAQSRVKNGQDVLKVDADEDGIGGDDCADALRYLVATKPREIVVRKLRGF